MEDEERKEEELITNELNTSQSLLPQSNNDDRVLSIFQIRGSRKVDGDLEVEVVWKVMKMNDSSRTVTTWEKVKDIIGNQITQEATKRYIHPKQNVLFEKDGDEFWKIRQKEMHRTTVHKNDLPIGTGFSSLLVHSASLANSHETPFFVW